MMKVSESYWRALCITLGVAIGYFIFHTPAVTTIQIRLEIPAPIQTIDEWGEREVRCLRDVIYNESRNQDTAGQIAVGAVVINRVLDKRWRATVCGVTRQRSQFAAWTPKPSNKIDGIALLKAEAIAVYVLNNYAVIDEELRSYKYFNSGRARSNVAQTVGDHHFYEEYS